MFGGDTKTIEQGCNLAGEHGGTFSGFQPAGGRRRSGISKTILQANRSFRRHAAERDQWFK
jgi:hypothetical protein